VTCTNWDNFAKGILFLFIERKVGTVIENGPEELNLIRKR